MPTYAYRCVPCDHEFDVIKRMAESSTPEACTQCEGETRKLVLIVGHSYQGSDFPTKAGRINGQMAKKNERLDKRQAERIADGGMPGGKLVPNVAGEQVDSWGEAAKLAKSKGKNTTGYEKMAAKE